jgi:hypothetical protein
MGGANTHGFDERVVVEEWRTTRWVGFFSRACAT